MTTFETEDIGGHRGSAQALGPNGACARRARSDRFSTAKRALAWTCAAAFGLSADASLAAVVTLQSVDEGEYVSSTAGTEFSGNYRATIDTGGFNWRNFLVFDLAGISGTVTSATLFIPGFGATIIAPSPVTFALHAVSTSPAVLLAGGDGATNIYADLADGTLYGSVVIQNPADNSGLAPMPDVTVSLAGALADINGGLGAFLAIGGDVAAPSTPSVVLWRGLNTSNAAFKPTLTLEVGEVPLPPGALLLLAGFGALVLRARRPRPA